MGYFTDISARNPPGAWAALMRVANGVLFAMNSTLLINQALHIDGGATLT